MRRQRLLNQFRHVVFERYCLFKTAAWQLTQTQFQSISAAARSENQLAKVSYLEIAGKEEQVDLA